jgi:hypothetical protein
MAVLRLLPFVVLYVARAAFGFSLDLDGNGVSDTSYVVRTCRNDSRSFCVSLTSSIAALNGRELYLWKRYQLSNAGADRWAMTSLRGYPESLPVSDATCSQSLNYDTLYGWVEPIGTHVGNYQNLFVSFYIPEKCAAPTTTDANGSTTNVLDSNGRPVVYIHYRQLVKVYDVGAGSAIAWAQTPVLQTAYFQAGSPGRVFSGWHNPAVIGFPKDPNGRRFPFLAPGYGDMNIGPGQVWGFLCVFSASSPGDPNYCGKGFMPIMLGIPGEKWFLESGFLLSDANGDGWEDLTLPYHGAVQTISLRDGAVVTTQFNPSGQSMPSANNVHSGRLYGTHSAVTGIDGMRRHVIVAGEGVGTFSDPYCSVSRFTAVLENPPGTIAQRTLKWSVYTSFLLYSFACFYSGTPCTVCDAQNPLCYFDSSTGTYRPQVSRDADMQNGCIHRFRDGVSRMDGKDVVIFNQFDADPYAYKCSDEQYAVYTSNWDPNVYNRFVLCLGRVRDAARGRWRMITKNMATGAGLTGSMNTYVWGMSTDLVPSPEPVYFVELLPTNQKVAFWHTLDGSFAKQPLYAFSLVKALWTSRGKVQLSTDPTRVFRPVQRANGYPITVDPDDTVYYDVRTRPNASVAGLVDILLTDGDPTAPTSGEQLRWYGYNPSTSSLAMKDTAPP